MQAYAAYSDPSRADDPWSLPDVEIMQLSRDDFLNAHPDSWMAEFLREAINDSWADESTESAKRDASKDLAGWYWWTCLPGCMPDSDPIGPFKTEAEALADAQGE